MDMNTIFQRRHIASVERGDTIAAARDRWTKDRTLEIVEALAGLTADGRPSVFPSVLRVLRTCSFITGTTKEVSVFDQFGAWLADHSELLTSSNTRDLLANPMRLDVRLFNQFGKMQAEFECARKSDDFFAVDRSDT